MYVSTYFIHIVCINCLHDPHTPPLTVTGLLDYQLTVQLRSLRKEHWDDQFRHVDCREGVFDEGYAVFSVVKPDQRVKINTEEFVLPWKTDIFKGKVKVHMLWCKNIVLWRGRGWSHTLHHIKFKSFNSFCCMFYCHSVNSLIHNHVI